MIEFTIPWECLVADNRRMYRQSKTLTDEYRHAKDTIAMIAMAHVKDGPAYTAPPITVRYDFYPPDFRRRDCSNYLKLLNDALEGPVWSDDWHITDLSWLRHPPDGSEPRVEVRVEP